jgi:hypothetical protein
MSTAIVRVYTSEGFAIGADGRKYDLETKESFDSTRKIFWIKEPDRILVYALAGTVEFTAEGTGKVLFSYNAAIGNAVQELAEQRHKSLWHYADAMKELLVDAASPFEEEAQPTLIYLDGYYEGRPKRAHIRFFHDGEQVPEVSANVLEHGFPTGCGTEEIIKALNERDWRLAKYRTPSWEVRNESRTLSNAIEVAKTWLWAHRSKEALEIDPLCAAIGGDLHICTITPSGGIQWVPGFKPQDNE